MTFILWMAVLGTVLLTLALTSSCLRWMPVTTSAVSTQPMLAWYARRAKVKAQS
ncbi:hypothetical protein [Pseudomonas graminis]